MRARSVISHIWALKSIWVTVLAVLLPLNLVLYQSDSDEPLKSSEELRSRCAYVIVVMAILWLTEAIPIPVTALMPIFLFPLTGVLPASVVSATYVSDTTMLFLGLMLTTWFLSMWISNTAAASMMIPIITAVSSAVREVKMKSGVHSGHENEAYDMEGIEENNGVKSKGNKYVINKQTGSSAQERKSTRETTKGEEQKENLRELSKSEENELRRLSKGLALSVAYGANIGGIATLTGTPPNLILCTKRPGRLPYFLRQMDGFRLSNVFDYSVYWLAMAGTRLSQAEVKVVTSYKKNTNI
ncbi:S13A3-like protein [Mya arenaria]|uniref:S13A3-like protein n=1 Tax=Mya arenaria TaxID=6604 RepID=A0ABY7DZN9_MYAAR|nr:S13A3-like protein [Mya arenaria]